MISPLGDKESFWFPDEEPSCDDSVVFDTRSIFLDTGMDVGDFQGALEDDYEVSTIHTNPLSWNTDADGLNDGQEARGWEISIFYERSMEVKENRTVYSNPLIVDTEGDGINDLYEFQNGADPNCVDTDGDLLLDSEEIYAENGTQRSNPCGIEGTPPKLSKLNTNYVDKFSTWNGITYWCGWQLQISVFAEDTAGLATIKFTLVASFFSTKTQTYKFSAGTKSGTATVKFDIDLAASVVTGYDLNVTAADGNGNMGYKVTHIKSITEIIVDLVVGALTKLAKIIAEAVSAAINFIWDLINKLFDPVITAIQNAINKYIANILSAFSSCVVDYSQSGNIPQKDKVLRWKLWDK